MYNYRLIFSTMTIVFFIEVSTNIWTNYFLTHSVANDFLILNLQGLISLCWAKPTPAPAKDSMQQKQNKESSWNLTNLLPIGNFISGITTNTPKNELKKNSNLNSDSLLGNFLKLFIKNRSRATAWWQWKQFNQKFVEFKNNFLFYGRQKINRKFYAADEWNKSSKKNVHFYNGTLLCVSQDKWYIHCYTYLILLFFE